MMILKHFGLFVKDIEKKRMKFTVRSYPCG